MYSPLEQFQISIFIPITLSVLDFSLTNFSGVAILIGVFILTFFFIGVRKFSVFNIDFFQQIFETIYQFVKGTMFQQAGPKGFPYLGWALTAFILIFSSNFLGLFGVSLTLTAQLAVTVGLAFSINLGFLFLGFQLHGVSFLKFFVPSGIPVFLVPFMVVIEVFSYCIRSISLSVRLFANMMAGHTLLHIIGSFFLTLFWAYNTYTAFIPLFLIVAIFFLEVVIAFLQAYVFLTLFCIYLNDSLSGGH